jgi:hypothetical protein
MDQALLVAIAVFISGLVVGYVVRDRISRHRRAKAKRSRRFFYDDPLATDKGYLESLSASGKAANPLKIASLNISGEVTAAPKRPIVSFQRGAAVAVPSQPPTMA